MIVFPAAVLIAAAPPQPTHMTIDRPYLVAPAETEGVAAITVRGEWVSSIRSAQSAIIHDFPLGLDRAVVLDLDRREIVDQAATLRLNEAGTFTRPGVAMFGGHVAGDHDSLAYLAFSEHFTFGYIRTEGQEYIVSSGPVGQGLETVVYNLAELPEGAIDFLDTRCEALDIPGRDHQPARRGVAFLGDPPCRVADVAIETDTEFRTNLFGGNATAAADYATALVGANSEIYERDLNVKLNITFLRIWTTTDPWTQNGGTIDQLFQFQDYWNANMTSEARSGAHYFSGRALGGGVAYLGALCIPEFDYALSANLNGFFPYPLQNQNTQNWDVFVTAHEWGHNFGAPHTHEQAPLSNIDNCASGNCSQLPGTIMSYCHLCGNGTGSVNLNFHPQNINSWMLPYLQNDAPCDLTGDPLCNTNTCVADTNGDGQLTPADFSAWVAAFNAQAPACDQNADGSCTPADFSAWVANYNAGCN